MENENSQSDSSLASQLREVKAVREAFSPQKNKSLFSAREISKYWNVHHSTVLRRIRRLVGYGGFKFGEFKQSSRCFPLETVLRVEALAEKYAAGKKSKTSNGEKSS